MLKDGWSFFPSEKRRGRMHLLMAVLTSLSLLAAQSGFILAFGDDDQETQTQEVENEDTPEPEEGTEEENTEDTEELTKNEKKDGGGAGGGDFGTQSHVDPEPAGPPSTGGVQPSHHSDNTPSCSSINSTWSELKVPSSGGFPGSGTYGNVNALQVQITVTNTPDGQTFSWAVLNNADVFMVMVKGGPDHNRYSYPSGSQGDGALHAPVNIKSNHEDNEFYGLSHVTFCYQPPQETTITASKTAAGSWERENVYDWTIEKEADEEELEVTPGNPVDITYTIEVTRTKVSSSDTITVSGEICVQNTGSNATKGLKIVDTLQKQDGATWVDIDSQTITPSQQVPAGEERCHEYEFSFDESDSFEEGTYRNKAVVTITNFTGHAGADHGVTITSDSFAMSPNVTEIDATADAEDVFEICPTGFTCTLVDTGEGTAQWHFTGDDTVSYKVTVTNDDAECDTGFTLENEVVLTEGDSGAERTADASVDVYSGECERELRIVKLWNGSETPPENLDLQEFELTIAGIGPNEGSLTCSYEAADNLIQLVVILLNGGNGDPTLVCEGDLDVGDGETVEVTESGLPTGWSGPETAEASCETEGNLTTCTIEIDNERDLAELEVDKTPDGDTINPGDDAVFTIKVTSLGPDTARNVTLTDELPGGLAWEITSQSITDACEVTSGVLSCDIGDLAPDASFTVTVSAPTTAEDCGLLDNEAATADADNAEETSDSGDITVECTPDVAVSKGPASQIVEPGEHVTFNITVNNEGDSTALNVTLTDDLHDDFTDVQTNASGGGICTVSSGNLIECSWNEIPAGENRTVTVTATATEAQCPEVTNTASVAADNEPGANQENNESETVDVELECDPDVELTKTNDADEDGTFSNLEEALEEGQAVEFRVVVTNTSSVDVRITSLTDVYPGVSAFDVCAELLGVVLGPGESSEPCFFTINGYAPEPDGSLTNTVTVGVVDEETGELTAFASDTSTVTTPDVLPEIIIRVPDERIVPDRVLGGGSLALTGGAFLGLLLLALTLLLSGGALSAEGRRRRRKNA